MLKRKNILVALVFSVLVFGFTAPRSEAKSGKEYEKIVKHLKTKYQAQKVKIPFVWLARFAVRVVRPAGVKSFSVTMFENLKFSNETLDAEMQTAMRASFGEEWTSILRVRSRTGEQVYMYMREAGKSVKLAVVTIDKKQAAVIRAAFSPEKLADFVNNPKIFGISLNETPASNKAATTPNDSTSTPSADKQKSETEN